MSSQVSKRSDIEIINGELLRMYVKSEVAGKGPYLVDLADLDGNGRCSCEYFQMHCEPRLNHPSKRFQPIRCKHIQKARDWLLDCIIQDLKKNHE